MVIVGEGINKIKKRQTSSMGIKIKSKQRESIKTRNESAVNEQIFSMCYEGSQTHTIMAADDVLTLCSVIFLI